MNKRKRIIANECNARVEELPYPKWFGVSHGIDGYGQAIDLSEVVSFKYGERYVPDNKRGYYAEDIADACAYDYTVTVEAILRSGRMVKIEELTPKGFEVFLKGISENNKITDRQK